MTINPGARPLVAGIDLGGTKILGRVLDPADPTIAIATVRADTPRGPGAIIEAIEQVIRRLEDEVFKSRGALLSGVGIGAAGLVGLDGVLRFAPNLPTVVDLDLVSALGEVRSTPVVVDNDANCATYAELRLGAALGSTNVVVVTLGTGIGAGVVIDGVLRRGATGFGGEPGHMVIDPGGPPCPCGRNGCWERFASGSGLGRLAREAAEAGRADHLIELAGGSSELVRGEHVTLAALKGDLDAQEVMVQFAWWVALGLANLVNVFDPELVVIGGGLAAAGDLLLEPTRSAFQGLVLAADHRRSVRIEAARFGQDAGAIGAGLLALDIAAAAEPARESGAVPESGAAVGGRPIRSRVTRS